MKLKTYANPMRMNTRIIAKATIQPQRMRNSIQPKMRKMAVTGPALWGLYHAPPGSVWNTFQQQPCGRSSAMGGGEERRAEGVKKKVSHDNY